MKREPKGADDLSLDAIVSAAVVWVDEYGLDSLTMRGLASSMGVFPTALYWYVDSKARLIALATSAAMGEASGGSDSGSWTERLDDIARQTRMTLHRHPNFASLLASQIQLDPAGDAARVERILEALDLAGFAGDQVTFAFNAFVGGVIGWVCMELSAPPPIEAQGEDWPSTFSASLSRQSSTDLPSLAVHLPRLSNRAFMTRWESGATNPLDDSFDFFLRTLIGGLRRQLPAKTV